MWVREENGTPVEVIESPRRVLVGDTNHPTALFTLWTTPEKEAIGIFPASVNTSGDGDLKRRTGSLHSWPKARVGGAYVITPTYENFPRAEVRALIRDEARRRILDEITEKPNGNWETFRLAIRARAVELLTAFDASTPINIRTGAINGAGTWPV